MRSARTFSRLALPLGALLLVAIGDAVAQDPPVPPAQDQPRNRLANEASPYLRQHAGNPVHWWPWGSEALAHAAREDKPIFLSIGYSACHWCHVMAKESFADAEVAEVMNSNFVCIKVDREERPDVDEIYMASVQAMGQQGGWPLSVWLTPAGKPFYGGTYFPPADKNGLPGFRRVCEQLGKAWRERRPEVLKGADELTSHLARVLAPELAAGEPTAALLAALLPAARARFDSEHGGFGQAPHWAPKFPSALELQALLGLQDDDALALVVQSLHAMARGGVYDQLGGGFHRYAVDRAWRVPHFEKMLYDNALLAPLYLEAGARTEDARLTLVGIGTLNWLVREMQAPGGGFWSSQDAQSEGVEGKFYVWQQRELEQVLRERAALLCAHFGVTAAGNWEGTNVLAVALDHVALAKQFDRDPGEVGLEITGARAELFAARSQRVRPATDDKILAAWNGLALRALANGYRMLGDERYRDAARAAADFVLRTMVENGRLLRASHGGRARHAGCLEDYGAVADGLLALFEIDPDPRWLLAARDLLGVVAKRFRAADGSLWFTADDQAGLAVRTKVVWDASTPSGTALAAGAFLRAGLLLGDEALYDHGVAALRSNHGTLSTVPLAAPALVSVLQFHVGGPREVIVAGEPDDLRTGELLRAAWALPGPKVVALVHKKNRGALEELSPVFVGKQPVDGAPAAYVCRRGACQKPVTDVGALGAAW